MGQRNAGLFHFGKKMIDPKSLKVIDQALISICGKLGGIHKAIQLLDLLHPHTQLFSVIPSEGKVLLKPLDVKQYLFTSYGSLKLNISSTKWLEFDESCLPGAEYYRMADFLDQLNYAVNHGVYVPENIYFQTIDRIKLLKEPAHC